MIPNQYIVGDQIKLIGPFTNTDTGAPVDPTIVTCRILQPDGEIVDLSSSTVKDSVGVYHALFVVTQVGPHFYEFIGTGAAIGAGRRTFFVTDMTF